MYHSRTTAIAATATTTATTTDRHARRGPRSARLLGAALVLAGALTVTGPLPVAASDGEPADVQPASPYEALSFELIAECGDQLLAGVRITNSGAEPIDVSVGIGSNTGSMTTSRTVPAGDVLVDTRSFNLPTLFQVRVSADAGQTLLFDSGERASIGASGCNEPAPLVGEGLTFSTATTCAAGSAQTTVDITNALAPVDLKVLRWIDSAPV
ncbi:MAG: hypothetical protein ACLGHQ_07715, partial [Acidimicrobiia bacterium]